MPNELTTLICLFHHENQAQAALEDILKAGVPESSVTTLGGPGSSAAASRETLASYKVPTKDIDHLLEGIGSGGSVVVVSAIPDHQDKVEDIFEAHKASKIDDQLLDGGAVEPLAASTSATGDTVIPIAAEELEVGKRTVDAGGVRVYRRIVEIPVEEQVSLREEHVSVERHAVDRPVTDADLALQGERTIELTETAEEAVVGKSARVVEEVLVGKEVSHHTETIHDTVRHTEVEVEEVAPTSSTLESEASSTTPRKTY